MNVPSGDESWGSLILVGVSHPGTTMMRRSRTFPLPDIFHPGRFPIQTSPTLIFPTWIFPAWIFPTWIFPTWAIPTWTFPTCRFPTWTFPYPNISHLNTSLSIYLPLGHISHLEKFHLWIFTTSNISRLDISTLTCFVSGIKQRLARFLDSYLNIL